MFSPDKGCLIVDICRWLLRGQPKRDSRLVVLVYDKDQACPASTALGPLNKFGLELDFHILVLMLSVPGNVTIKYLKIQNHVWQSMSSFVIS